MVFEIGDASRAEARAAQEDRSGREADGLRPSRLQGARPQGRRPGEGRGTDVHARAATCRSTTLARSVEAEALRLLEEYKPGRRLQTNVEFYTALLLHGLGVRRRAVYADVRHQPRERLDRALRSSSDARTASSGRSRIRRSARQTMGAARTALILASTRSVRPYAARNLILEIRYNKRARTRALVDVRAWYRACPSLARREASLFIPGNLVSSKNRRPP